MTSSPVVIALLVVMAILVSSPATFARTIDEDAIRAIMLTTGRLGNRCMTPGQYCSAWEIKICCEGLHCQGPNIGADKECVPIDPVHCPKLNQSCNKLTKECCYPYQCSGPSGYCQNPSSANEVVEG